MTPLERAARALADADGCDFERYPNMYLGQVLAVLHAIKGPSEAMIHAGTWAHPPRLAVRWDAMCDAMIEEGHPPHD